MGDKETCRDCGVQVVVIRLRCHACYSRYRLSPEFVRVGVKAKAEPYSQKYDGGELAAQRENLGITVNAIAARLRIDPLRWCRIEDNLLTQERAAHYLAELAALYQERQDTQRAATSAPPPMGSVAADLIAVEEGN